MLAYKAKQAGITVVFESERNTSRRCSACGCVDANHRVHRGLYICSECGATVNADVNGAVNIMHKYLQGLDDADESGTGVPVRVGDLPTIWPEPLVNRYGWGEPSPIVRVAGSVPAGDICY
jgi:transposase